MKTLFETLLKLNTMSFIILLFVMVVMLFIVYISKVLRNEK